MLAITWLVLLVRFGLLAFVIGFFAQNITNAYPFTLRFDQMHSGPSMLVLGLMVAVLIAAVASATAGRSLLDDGART